LRNKNRDRPPHAYAMQANTALGFMPPCATEGGGV